MSVSVSRLVLSVWVSVSVVWLWVFFRVAICISASVMSALWLVMCVRFSVFSVRTVVAFYLVTEKSYQASFCMVVVSIWVFLVVCKRVTVASTFLCS